MTDTRLEDRFTRQLAVKFADRELPLQLAIRDLDAQANANGTFLSSGRVLQVHKIFSDEFEARAALAWECLARAHSALGVPADDKLRDRLKALMTKVINDVASELNTKLEKEAARSRLGAGITSRIDQIQPNVLAKYDVEADLYVDSLRPYAASSAQPVVPAQQYIFNGPVGSFQTGAHSTATVTQSISTADTAPILEALSAVQAAISLADGLSEQKRKDLLQVAQECAEQVQLPERNEIKLQGLFSILTTTIQTIPNALPAYEALRTALAHIGLS